MLKKLKHYIVLFGDILIDLGYYIIALLRKLFHFVYKLFYVVLRFAGIIDNKVQSLVKRRLLLKNTFLNQIKNKLDFVNKKSTEEVWVPQYAPIKNLNQKVVKINSFKLFLLGFLLCFLFILIPSHVYLWFSELPNTDLLVSKYNPTSTKIMDRKGRLLYEIYIDKKYEPVKLDKIPDTMIKATISVEDDGFYNHVGFDLKSIIRAFKSTFFENKVQGGSTITQQLVKNVLLYPDRNFGRKIKELVLSVFVEMKYSKQQILEFYLNNISYGGSAWGVQSAAQKFFNKNVWELTLGESAMLAGLPSAPSSFSPFGPDINIAKQRQQYVLDRMYKLGYITKKEADTAYDEKLKFNSQEGYIRAPHFVAYVVKELEALYGRRMLETGGLSVITTLDLDLQDKSQEIVAQEIKKSSLLKISNGSAIILDVSSGEVLAYVGSVDYFIKDWGAYDIATALRQPGSSIKPLTYLLAFDKGMTPVTLIKDAPVTYPIQGQKAYSPQNYDGKYHGDVSVRSALANSYNIPAVKIAEKVGPDNIVKLGKQFGLSNWQLDNSYGLAITLGGKEVKLVEHTNMYAAFARKGVYKPHTTFLSIKDSKGFDLYKDKREAVQVTSPENAYLLWNILSDNEARTPAFGRANALIIPDRKVAVKTGTTDNKRDNFTLGYTPQYAVGVWVGNNDNSPLDKNLASGISGAAPIWNKIMSILLKDAPNELMEIPEGIVVIKDSNCNKTEYFIKSLPHPDHLCLTEKEKKELQNKKNSD